ncbi:MAG: LysR family transcriptional regulator substrate-binding protein [Lactobacillus kefiranofaciens]|uniref:LysR substrate binding domain-containing protein n=2 Tax=Lactobacillus kefiranofaciens TaxID=267818 RepID=A0ABY0M941_9LACO|nr:Transcriptional regulator [Lactobacillus kefiranofaciens subsp. kefiranofaciens]KRL29252.1 ArsR family transcriptional regulator [Lactobacillus kefiranofaciens subsp. kefirgranum DSM 10550 = JCM 8572]KRM23101.1 ArsR family transcriptional regulator [Lactobacillus kefiranofaciens subsp. kefiranofaciens DSM 5016 = JCM 6985]SDA37706.1 LysR substrate binding domain-containing protein [Lactobacillus kefiranofaciens]
MNKMNELKVAYFNQLGQIELKQAKRKFERKYPDCTIKLIATGYDAVFEKLADQEVDLGICDLRDEQNDYHQTKLARLGIKAVLPKDSFPNGMQMIDKAELADLPCFIVAKPEEEVVELHLFKDLYRLPSHFIAANSVAEAALLVASGSGYFLLNENTVKSIRSEDLQSLFLLDHQQQLWQTIMAFYPKESTLIYNFLAILQKEY